MTSLVWCQKLPDVRPLQMHGGLTGDDHEVARNMIRKMLRHAIDNDLYICGWNLVYDISVCIAYGFEEEVFKVKWLDGMLLWKHWFKEPEYKVDRHKRKSYGLKPCVEEHLPEHAGYADDVSFHDTDPAERAKLHAYNERDTGFSWVLVRKWYRLLQQYPQRLKCALIEAQCLPQIALINFRGLPVDTLATKELDQLLIDTAADRLASLAPYGVDETIVRSPTKLAVLMYDDWKLPVLKENTGKKTGKVSRATDKEVLHELAFIDNRAQMLREYREALNNRTKFATTILNSAKYNGDGNTHPQAIIFGTYSGRFTYASQQTTEPETKEPDRINPKTGKVIRKAKPKVPIGFALHQEKRDKVFRSAVTTPEGYGLLEWDAAGQEFRWMAIASGDETMLSLCAPGEDPHSYMGARILEMDYKEMMRLVAAKDEKAANGRQGGKVGNLSLQYRTSARKLRVVARVNYNMPMTENEAKFIWKTYRETYPGVPKYWARQIRDTRMSGYVETFAGRQVQVVGNWDGPMGWSMGSTAINYRIQGCLHWSSRVLTTEGLKMIGVMAENGRPYTVWTGFKWASAVAVNRGAGQYAEIELDSGEVIRCDTRHKLKDGNRAWVEFKDMYEGMLVSLPAAREPLKAGASVSWAYVLGFFVGDGWLTRRPRGKNIRYDFGICGGVSKYEKLRKIKAFLERQGLIVHERITAKGVMVVGGQSRELFESLVSKGFRANERARTKMLPKQVWSMTEQQRRNFWEGICDSDGSKVKGQERNLHTPNEHLVRDLQVFVSALGFDASISTTKQGKLLRVNGPRGYRPYPQEVLQRDLDGLVPSCAAGDNESIVDRRAAQGEKGVTQGVAERIYAKHLPHIREVYRYARIKSIRVLDEVADTFTLSVDDPLHQFVADGVIHKNTGADQKYLAMAVLQSYMREQGAYFAWDLHDGLYWYVPLEKLEKVALTGQQMLANLPYKQAWGLTPPIPLPWDAKIGGSWGDLKDFKG